MWNRFLPLMGGKSNYKTQEAKLSLSWSVYCYRSWSEQQKGNKVYLACCFKPHLHLKKSLKFVLKFWVSAEQNTRFVPSRVSCGSPRARWQWGPGLLCPSVLPWLRSQGRCCKRSWCSLQGHVVLVLSVLEAACAWLGKESGLHRQF